MATWHATLHLHAGRGAVRFPAAVDRAPRLRRDGAHRRPCRHDRPVRALHPRRLPAVGGAPRLVRRAPRDLRRRAERRDGGRAQRRPRPRPGRLAPPRPSRSDLRRSSVFSRPRDGSTGSRMAREAARAVVHLVVRRHELDGGRERLRRPGVAGEPRCAPPETCRRSRWPVRSRCAHGSRTMRTVDRLARGPAGVEPDEAVREVAGDPAPSTSQSRTKTSACGLSVLCTSSTTGVPTTSTSPVSGGR
jgi:hypothetical protein